MENTKHYYIITGESDFSKNEWKWIVKKEAKVKNEKLFKKDD